ncbi:hypothetical protein B0T26DRAFT_657170 [Lasiosphaeria miniovina]|uniref:Uncharacterized protein n=1 Tax=Lasiosphaeria miniovina TaxID=1954250 RepID=A0AA40DK69_9PEZI|nr:uncharacterized protein B0T26DRAFT_657170 [Lasiosphaeria miniovina]KAK0703837.1 hypothetical protein B0T26DRAFT_657170 [Lasiosphaeria miniovina]
MSSPSRSPVEVDVPAESLDVVETPTSPSSGLALSRFEFETGKGNEGTKILMVEWDTVVAAQVEPTEKQEIRGPKEASEIDWEVSWEGKEAVLPIRDADSDANGKTRRVYFLLPPGAPVPALVSITPKGAHENIVLHTKPMPAIFLAELGGAEEAGQRGVLHTIWAKKRLAELKAEIAAELKDNGESVGLEMALQERQWIVDHFGLAPQQGIPKPTRLHTPQTPVSPASPRSPIGGRLGEKLRGLRLATSPLELAAATQAAKSAQPRARPLVTTASANPSNTAVSSFANSGGRLPAKPSGNASVASLDAIVGSGLSTAAVGRSDDTTEEELFALPMSPRSPEMKKSPFSLL